MANKNHDMKSASTGRFAKPQRGRAVFRSLWRFPVGWQPILPISANEMSVWAIETRRLKPVLHRSLRTRVNG